MVEILKIVFLRYVTSEWSLIIPLFRKEVHSIFRIKLELWNGILECFKELSEIYELCRQFVSKIFNIFAT